MVLCVPARRSARAFRHTGVDCFSVSFKKSIHAFLNGAAV